MVAEIQAVSLRTTLVLMIVFIVLGSFAMFDPLRRAEKNDQKKDLDEHVVWLKDKKLEGLSIAGKNPLTELVCTMKDGCPFDGSGDWRLNKPVEGRADPTAAGTLASTILNLRQNEKLEFDAAPDPKEFGLDQPKAELTVKVKGEKDPIVLKFGKNAAVGPNVYLSVSGEPKKIFLVPSYVPDMVNKDSFHWQDKRILPGVESNNFTRLGWKTKKQEVRAFKLGETWRLDRPVATEASQIMIAGLASTIAYATATGVFSPWRGTVEAKELLKGKPELEIVFATSDGAGHEVQLFTKPKAPKELVAVIDKNPVMFSLDNVAFERFKKPVNEYRKRSVLEDNVRSQIDEVRFTWPREKRESFFKLTGVTWKYASGAQLAEPLSSLRITSFLDSLRDSVFTAYNPAKGNSAEAKAMRSQTPDLVMELSSSGKQLLAAKFVVHDRGAALTEADGEVRSLGGEFLRVLPVRLTDLGESSNKQVVVKPKEEADGDHSEPESANDSHRH